MKLTAETITDTQIRELMSRMGISQTDQVIKEQCIVALATYMDQHRARAWCAEYLNAESARNRCRSCPHPPHRGLCTGQYGGTAYRCGCHVQEIP